MVLTNLYALFRSKSPTASNIRDIFLLEGQVTAPSEPAGATAQDLELHSARCLRHLERAHEVIHACRFNVNGFLERYPYSISSGTIPSSIELEGAFRFLYHEIDTLCRKPLLFHGIQVFDATYGLKGKICYMLGLLKTTPENLISYLQQEVVPTFDSLLSLIFKEIEELLEE